MQAVPDLTGFLAGLFLCYLSLWIRLINAERSIGYDFPDNRSSITTHVSRIRRDEFRESKVITPGITLPYASSKPSAPSPAASKMATVIPGCEPGTLDVCSRLPMPAPVGHGIPANPAAIDKACKNFNQGMDCYHNWAKRCIKTERQIQKFNASVIGAHEIYTFICRDPIFRQDFLQHSKCYVKISRRWDECAKRFISVLKNHNFDFEDETDMHICCLRIRFVQCVMQVTHHFCDAEDPTAARFIQQMAETLLRNELHGHLPERCVQVKHNDCPNTSSARKINSSLISLCVLPFYFLLK